MPILDLTKFSSDRAMVLSGREKGESVRASLGIDSLDAKFKSSGDIQIFEISIPDWIIHVNSSFFLGLIGKTVEALGPDRALQIYKVGANTRIQQSFKEAVDRVAMRGSILPVQKSSN